MNRSVTAVAAVLLMGAGAALAAGDHAAAPMMASPQKPLTEDDLRNEANAPQRSESATSIIDRFKSGFGRSNPRIAVFWNRDFSEQVSDWASTRRIVVSGKGNLQGEVPDGKVQLDGNGSQAAQAEFRSAGASAKNSAPAFDLQAGFISQMGAAGVQVLDRTAIMRITDNALETGDFSRLSPDQARLEMRALGEHADYLLELSQVKSREFHIRVLDVRNGSVQTMLSSNGQPPESDKDRRWVATDHGFEKKKHKVTLADVGQELALQTLAKMAN